MCDAVHGPGSLRRASREGSTVGPPRGCAGMACQRSSWPAMKPATTDSTLWTFPASDGNNLAMQDWPLLEGVAPRGVVVLVHGLGEHAGRYDHVARPPTSWGFAVPGYDQYGHGESDGVRGALPGQTRLVDDLADVVDSTRARMETGTPLILLGHSVGGLVAASAVALGQVQVDALVLSSPALDPGLNGFQ